ncbi:group 1 truncated hemoglobin [Stappia sp. F7233]|uniref:Group 1 truncated hemoglobin n=1 Tax=Stappia albiluteola TaxID=2758565 RepID=A0A839ACY4_9HYPH|nr:group 1 truncated hemoglobin [Stappia albiluteola]MBA5777006.1 group 1 truncated hemoglobin [Stappia albiluteola]
MSLYEAIGGKEPVNAAVEIFYKKILDDNSLSHFFDNMDVQKQKMKMRTFLYYALGGESTYSGRDLRSSHKDLNLTDEHFNKVAEHLQSTLAELSVSDSIIAEILAVVETTRNDVLNRPAVAAE